MATVGLAFLVIAFVAAMAAAATLFAGHFAKHPMLNRVGRVGVAASAVALLVCCGVLVFCFMTGNLHLNRKVRIFGQSSMRDRLAVYLAECETDDQGFAIVPYSQTGLARFLGVNRSALSREMGRMRDEGVLVTDGSRMRLARG